MGEGPATTSAGFITVEGHLFAPLQGLDPANARMGGYGFLDKTDGGATFHPGVDLNSGSGDCNSDEGAGVVAPLAGVVRAVLSTATSGEGNHVWLELDDWALPGPTWMHVDHLLAVDVYEGQRLSPGERFAPVRAHRGWSCAHLHTGTAPGGAGARILAMAIRLDEGPGRGGVLRTAGVVGRGEREGARRTGGGGNDDPVWGANRSRAGRRLGRLLAPRGGQLRHREQLARRVAPGVWRGAPLSDEQLIPEDTAEGKPGGSWRLFEGGACCWLPGEDASWNG